MMYIYRMYNVPYYGIQVWNDNNGFQTLYYISRLSIEIGYFNPRIVHFTRFIAHVPYTSPTPLRSRHTPPPILDLGVVSNYRGLATMKTRWCHELTRCKTTMISWYNVVYFGSVIVANIHHELPHFGLHKPRIATNCHSLVSIYPVYHELYLYNYITCTYVLARACLSNPREQISKRKWTCHAAALTDNTQIDDANDEIRNMRMQMTEFVITSCSLNIH
jgi:hypothetical protein